MSKCNIHVACSLGISKHSNSLKETQETSCCMLSWNSIWKTGICDGVRDVADKYGQICKLIGWKKINFGKCQRNLHSVTYDKNKKWKWRSRKDMWQKGHEADMFIYLASIRVKCLAPFSSVLMEYNSPWYKQ